MGIAFDASTDGGSAAATSLTFAHTCRGTDRLLVVQATGHTAGTGPGTCTYNGVAMTRDAANGKRLVPGGRWLYYFYLLNPTVGTHDVVFSDADTALCQAVAASYTGAVRFFGAAAFQATTPTTTVTATLGIDEATPGAWAIGVVESSTVNAAGTDTAYRQAASVGFAGILESQLNPLSPAPGVDGMLQVTGFPAGSAIILLAVFEPMPVSEGLPGGDVAAMLTANRNVSVAYNFLATTDWTAGGGQIKIPGVDGFRICIERITLSVTTDPLNTRQTWKGAGDVAGVRIAAISKSSPGLGALTWDFGVQGYALAAGDDLFHEMSAVGMAGTVTIQAYLEAVPN